MICSGVRPVGFDDRQWLATGCGGRHAGRIDRGRDPFLSTEGAGRAIPIPS